ncbi:hypothetical protein A1Q1_06915 [Trichosporon asahii var. asahii CBS 2479]|uniref:Uncharacterized protein n=1 Tax=Trichosporon asahii var. asahii (strain ATCC 90039 / CBS 2479 / JCM 2466 / KCTC 7840 / NBRC 103889/ NCYC 2677 / UAMH 7654) TaxID=1186058 RepID=J6F4A0_TRIAS|nr:hypothetical protein A1Q1_06915 [Trichosporon asahii var. asahii CBS 2479]EJT51829.1 hypothetical protein A1Q1_06915 [Trichosporon asahii var. asahii CBS 2479]
MPAPPASGQAYTAPASTPKQTQQVGTAGNVPVEKPVGGLRAGTAELLELLELLELRNLHDDMAGKFPYSPGVKLTDSIVGFVSRLTTPLQYRQPPFPSFITHAIPANPQLLGFSAATGLGIYYLQQDTKEAQGLLTSSVEELTRDTQRITTHLDRLQTTEKDLVALKKEAATKDDLVKLRAELKKACDSLHLENLDLRAHVWGIEQDLQKVAKEGEW